MNKIELRKIGSLRLHPDNVNIFGLPTDEPNYEEIREDIRKRGLQEPLIILNDGTILSGHIRYSGVWWTLEQSGLTSNQIKDELIAVRVHEDFASKEEELEYLMSANDKRRQLDPRRMATSLERMESILETSEVKKGKKGEALKRLADRLGVTFKLATTYRVIFSSKIVPDEYKDKVNAKSLATSTVVEAIKFAEESAKREGRAPSSEDVVIYIKTPRSKTTLADTIREAAKGSTTVVTSTAAPTPAPKPTPAPVVTVEASTEVPEPPKAPEPPKVEAATKIEDKPAPNVSISEEYFDDQTHEDPPETPTEKISTARRLLKESLKVLVLDDAVTSELLGLHTELASYLTAMNLIPAAPRQGLAIPTDSTELVNLCTSLLQGIGDIAKPQDTRDALADLVNTAGSVRSSIPSSTKTSLEPNGLYCPECLEPQMGSPSGAFCSNGHGGLGGITEEQVDQIKLSQDLSKEKFKCCFCGSQVETADAYATHANCPKCGLVDTSDIEPVTKTVNKNDELEIDLDLLDEVISPKPTSTQAASEDISADELAALLGQEEPKDPVAPKALEPKKTPEPQKVQEKKVETKRVSPPKAPAAAKSSDSEDSESYLVSAVIDDFELELQKAGVVTTA
jgi:transcription elongation factor Elf1